ncbi:MAG TPA: Tol-Pal system beta propeller repeat protein TolB, partial [Nitrospiraceae bacterium]|nr:Tol-Pal system beta propeller repeat protein TolB [Nitrospiraceae bacterium]
CLLLTAVDAKVYIDITAPALRKLPISLAVTGHQEGREILGIVKNNLNFTGIFYPLEQGAPGAELSVRIEAKTSNGIIADVFVVDLLENKEILRKRYSAPAKLLRAVAHSISNDIFKIVTGQNGVFRTKLAYVIDYGVEKELHIMDWDGYNSQRLVSKGLNLSPHWSHDGSYIAYSSQRDRSWEIYIMNLTTYKEKRLFSAEGLNLSGGFSPDGLLSFSSSKEGRQEIYVIHHKDGWIKRLTNSLAINVSPVFSPDGSHIAFVSNRGGSPQIYVMKSDGNSPKRLTFEGSYNTSPAWSPRGDWIAFVGRKGGHSQIFLIKWDGSEMRQLTDKGNNENPTFSPDGVFLAFDSDRDGSKGIYITRINGEGVKRITPKGIKATSPKWSTYIK